jgi:hypothetical protein
VQQLRSLTYLTPVERHYIRTLPADTPGVGILVQGLLGRILDRSCEGMILFLLLPARNCDPSLDVTPLRSITYIIFQLTPLPYSPAIWNVALEFTRVVIASLELACKVHLLLALALMGKHRFLRLSR